METIFLVSAMLWAYAALAWAWEKHGGVFVLVIYGAFLLLLAVFPLAILAIFMAIIFGN